jgi:SAM-dependent methyltransferase
MDDKDAESAYFFEVFEAMPRQGPGSDEATLRALRSLKPRLPPAPRVLDIGCGTGAQTRVLAHGIPGEVVAVDTHRPFLAILRREQARRPDGSRVMPVCASMFALPFRDRQFDLLWSEGAVYIMGLEQGLKAWRRLLRPGGLLVVSDSAWLTPSAPPEARAFWERECPGVGDLGEIRGRIAGAGYDLVDHFALPRGAWETSYYRPLEAELARLRARHPEDPAAEAVCTNLFLEIAMFRRARQSLGYVFWLLRPR